MAYEFRSKHSVRKNRTTFSEIPLLAEIFYRKDPTSRVPFPFQQDFLKRFVSGKQPLLINALPGSICVFLMFFFSHHVFFVDGTHA